MKTSNLPAGYKIEEISGGCRQHFPGGYREYQKIRGGCVTHMVTDGRTVSHDELNKIFKNSVQFQESKYWNDEFPFQLRSRTTELEQELAAQKKLFKFTAAVAAISFAGLAAAAKNLNIS